MSFFSGNKFRKFWSSTVAMYEQLKLRFRELFFTRNKLREIESIIVEIYEQMKRNQENLDGIKQRIQALREDGKDISDTLHKLEMNAERTFCVTQRDIQSVDDRVRLLLLHSVMDALQECEDVAQGL